MKTVIVHVRLAVCVPDDHEATCLADTLTHSMAHAYDTTNEILREQTMEWSDNSALLDYQIDGATMGPSTAGTYKEGDAFEAQALLGVPKPGNTFSRFPSRPVDVIGMVPVFGYPVIELDGRKTSVSAGCIHYEDITRKQEP